MNINVTRFVVIGKSHPLVDSENGRVQKSPPDPHSNGTNSATDNILAREDFPGFPSPGGIVKSGKLFWHNNAYIL